MNVEKLSAEVETLRNDVRELTTALREAVGDLYRETSRRPGTVEELGRVSREAGDLARRYEAAARRDTRGERARLRRELLAFAVAELVGEEVPV